MALYVNQGGRVVCPEHGGSYLRQELEADPEAEIFDTPIDNWVRVPDDESGVKCEECPFPPFKLKEVVCHFPAGDGCRYCREGKPHRHPRAWTGERPEAERLEWAGRADH